MRSPAFGVLLVLALLAAPSPATGAPPITSPIQAVARLRRAPDLAPAVEAVDRACRGRHRRTLIDHPGLVAEAKRLTRGEDPEARRRALDLRRCFSEPVFLRSLLLPRLDDPEPEVIAYAAEVAARLESAAVVPPLLDRLEARADRCARGGLPPPEVEVCVWLTYAPGTGLAAAARPLRERAGALAARMALESPIPKVREVAVETLAATRLRARADTVAELVRRERSGRFAAPSPPQLLGRFEARREALEAGDP